MKDKEKHLIKEANDALIKRWRNGENLARIDASATWFQPHPLIKKDEKAIAKIFGKKVESKKSNP